MASPFTVRFDTAALSGVSDGFGMPVVLLHGRNGDRRMWQGQFDALVDAGYHVVAYDRRGHGDTQFEDEEFDHLVDLEAVLDQLSLHAAVLCGIDEGGALAIDFAIANPGRTVGLVLIGTSLTGAEEPELPEEAEALIDARDYAEGRGSLDQVNRLDAHLWLDGPLEENGRVDGEARDLFLDMNALALRMGHPGEEEERDDATDAVLSITAPMLLLVGELDFPHIVERHDELSEEIENAFAVVIEEAAHLPQLERPDLVNPLLIEFLDAVTQSGPASGEE